MSRRAATAIWLWRHVSSKVVLLVLLVALALLASYMGSLPPVFVRYAIDMGVATGSLDSLLLYTSLLVLSSVASGAFNFLSRYVSARYSQEVVHRIRLEVFEAVLRKYMGFFDSASVGQLISRITNDSERVTEFLSNRLRMIIFSASLLAFSAVNMFNLQTLLSIVAVTSMLVVVIVYARYSATIRPLHESIRHQLGVVASVVSSDLVGIKTIKGLNAIDSELARFGAENARFAELNVRAAKMRALYGNSTPLIFGVASGLVLLYGAYAIQRGELTVGGLTMFITYLATLSRPLNMLGFSISDVQRALASAKRLFELASFEEAVLEKPDAIELNSVKGLVEFVNVVFTYPTGRRALRGVNLRVRPGERVLIVGPPGSGKSTLLKLLMRFYEPDEGRVLLDGIDIKNVKLSSLRQHIGYVAQEPFIFNGTIFENITLGNPNARFEEVVAAARIAKIHDFIESLPGGYNTVVGERGVDLSGGQRQRVAIARALVRNPRILLLDDPVANLDAETERALVEDLKEVVRGRTVIIVSQRLSLATLADRIIVMDDGQIVEEGTHEELLARGGFYYRLYMAMVGGGGRGSGHQS